MPSTPKFTVRLEPEYLERVRQVAEARGGLSYSQVIRLGIDLIHRQVIGRSARADRRPVRRRAK